MSEAISLSALVEPERGHVESHPGHPGLVGLDPISPVVMMEDHEGAYYAWKQAGISGRVLLHIDAHIDWNWIADKDPRDLLQAQSVHQLESMLEERRLWNLSGRKSEELVHIGNYIYPAVVEGIVKEFYWVVPDSFMESPAERRNLVRQFQSLKRMNPRAMKTVTVKDHRVVAEINNTKVTACTLSHLPDIQEPVLLDIDTDFLMREPHELLKAGTDPRRQLPWIWPDELIARLKTKGVRTDFATIAYSVEGGFTPLPYKYLGDELALRLKSPVLLQQRHQALEHRRQAACLRHRGKYGNAISEFERVLMLEPEDASSYFNLADLLDAQSFHDQAAAQYRRAVQLDPTYATGYNNFGSIYQSLGMFEKARNEYQRILRWDHQNVDAHDGLAQTLTVEGRWDDAISHYQAVIALRPDHAQAHHGLGFVYLKRKQWDEAITEFRRCLALKPNDGFTNFALGEALLRQRRWDEAIEAYRTALRCGIRTVTTHRRLGGLYLRKRKFYKALKQYRNALRAWGRRTLFSIGERSRMLFEKLSLER
jgi:tetratricopeptide (TPR) repeat protein